MKIDDLVNFKDNLIIFGTGGIANIVFLYLCSLGLHNRVLGFMVSKNDYLKQENGKKFGKKIFLIEEVVGLQDDFITLLAVQSATLEEAKDTCRNRGLKNIYDIDTERIIDHYYKELYQEDIISKRVLFTSYNGMGYGCNPKYIAEELLQSDIKDDIELIWAADRDDYSFPPGIKSVIIGTEEYYGAVATSGFWVNNCRMRADIRKRSGQFYIQVWHGAAPLKKVEKDVEYLLKPSAVENSKNDSHMADLFVSGSKWYTELYRNSFWYKGEILKVGVPRQDVFWKEKLARKKVYDHYGIDNNKSIILYAPTYREDLRMDAYNIDISRVMKACKNKFNKDFVFAVSKHPSIRYKDYSFECDYTDVSKYDDFEEILAATDILISDYSGCIYDYSFTGRPVFLFQADYDKYLSERNFYFSMDELPYPRAGSNEDLERIIEQFDYEQYKNKLKKFMDQMGNYDTGNASKSVANVIVSRMKALDKMEK